MRIAFTRGVFLASILYSIDFSSQFDCLPNGAPIYSFDRSAPAPKAPLDPIFRSSPPAESIHPADSRFPPANRHYVYIPELLPERLRLVRLIPNANTNQRFQIRKYTFPRDKTIQVIGKHNIRKPIPTEEQTVLSTSIGDIFAIIEGKYTYLRGIYMRSHGSEKRVKINMYSEVIRDMTLEEKAEAPLSKSHPISLNFDIILENPNAPGTHNPHENLFYASAPFYSGSLVRDSHHAEPILRARSNSPPVPQRHVYIPGLQSERLRYVRLIPKVNQDRKFEIRKYTFPRDESIQLKGHRNVRGPIPTEKQTVLSTTNGDIFAIFERNYTYLRGIYTNRYGFERRVRININSGAVEGMTFEERADAPIGKNHPISSNFDIILVDNFLQ